MQDGEPVPVPFESKYSVIALPSQAVISADKMNVVYRGLDNPISISVPGVGDKDISSSVPGNNKLKRIGLGKYILNPGSGKEVKINVSAKLSNGKTINTPKTFRIKDLPRASGTVRGEFDMPIKMPKSSVRNITVGAGYQDFVFDLQLIAQEFTIQVPNQKSVRVVGTKLNAQAKKLLEKARRGDIINIIDIKAVEKEKGIRIPKVSPILIKITN